MPDNWNRQLDSPVKIKEGERGGLVKYRTPNREALSSIPRRDAVLCSRARHINSPQYWLMPRKR